MKKFAQNLQGSDLPEMTGMQPVEIDNLLQHIDTIFSLHVALMAIFVTGR